MFAAIVRDLGGAVLAGQPVAWVSDSPAVATVSSTGILVGHRAGQARTRATSSGKSDTATVTIVDTVTPPPPDTTTPPPPDTTTPPPAGWPHEPAGLSLVSGNRFVQLAGSGWDEVWNDRGLASIVADGAAPASPTNVLQMAFPIGYTGGSGPANVWRPLPNLRRMYTGFWWKASDPWQGHSSNVNKILFIFPSSGGDIYITMYGPPGGPYELRVLPQFPGITSDWLRPNVNNVPVTLGSWHRIEWVIDYSAGGSGGSCSGGWTACSSATTTACRHRAARWWNSRSTRPGAA